MKTIFIFSTKKRFYFKIFSTQQEINANTIVLSVAQFCDALTKFNGQLNFNC